MEGTQQRAPERFPLPFEGFFGLTVGLQGAGVQGAPSPLSLLASGGFFVYTRIPRVCFFLSSPSSSESETPVPIRTLRVGPAPGRFDTFLGRVHLSRPKYGPLFLWPGDH